jgi:TPR repeat protein
MPLNSRHLVLPFFVPAVFFCPLLTPLLSTPIALADFQAGVEAYDGGDVPAALAEWRTAARAGDLDAQVALANLYAQGIGLPKDLSTAAYWYRRAALHGHPVAQLNLGELYRRGEGLPRRPVQAYLWFTLAAENDSVWATEQLKALTTTMTEAELSEAKTLVAGWPRQ